ncbi:hypothetical protein [Polynucleobacter kasalickyi]|uniref:Glycosyltransferase RgtA/B/C/D-like domain-containing protein n=1 Tax=Polynucleobacter kasalickyi TaxID=1938817 RepID=A0A1W1Y1P8_9BURK|nr:hypothetical protein [Polynucleobacter kasalickyi]SMC30083.1 hypothetical protein SAMN06296008_10120 [Polynucleobacter kasalickyi]
MKIVDYANLSKAIIIEKYLGYFFPIVAFSFAFYMQYSVAFFGLDLHHDLLMFDAARNLYSGQTPYKDFFYQYNLGTVLLHSATLGILGLKIVALKQVTVLFFAFIALLIYLSCALEGYRRSGLLLSILWTLLSPFYMPVMNGYHPWSTVYMMFSCMAGLFCLQLAIRKKPIVFSLLAGIFFSLGFWFKQVAAFQVIAVLIWIGLNVGFSFSSKFDRVKYIRIFSGYATGGLLATIPFLGYLYFESAIIDWWKDVFLFNKYFAAESQNASGLKHYFKILFPISRGLGHHSNFWALSPFILIVVTFQVFIFQANFFGLKKLNKEVLGLIVLAAFSGWFGCFPLPHPFHTQLFMAPTFIVIGLLLGKHPLSFKGIKKYLVVFLPVYIFLISAIHENYFQVQGWSNKQHAYNKDSIKVNLNSSFDGLRIDSSTENLLTQFYKNLLELKPSNKSGEFIPLSVDPLRGLLPGKVESPSEFKMGVDWTWPNELVEPGFSDLINSRILLRKQPIYADSLIYIAGYKPTALLEMKSPISNTHMLYQPDLKTSKLGVEHRKKSEILYTTDKDFDIKTRSIYFDWDEGIKSFNLIPFNVLTESEIHEIKNIHVSILHEEDFPQHLSKLQMGYLNKAGKSYSENLPGLYKLDNQEGGILHENISIEDQQKLALFMLSTGKLFANQNRPVYSSTLASNDLNQPMLVGLPLKERTGLQMLWSKDNGSTTNRNDGELFKARSRSIYLAIKPIIKKDKCKFILIQIEMSLGHTKNYYYIFEND